MDNEKEITPVAVFRSPFPSKFGIPRQSGVVKEIEGRISFLPEFAREEALRGLEDFEYVWILWGFSGNDGKWSLTVRPPRLGGNRSVGVFASRSPFRPNGMGLSSARIVKIENNGIVVSGADLMDGTPIYDIKPYIPYTDSHPEARAGFTDTTEWKESEVEFPDELRRKFLEMADCTSENHSRAADSPADCADDGVADKPALKSSSNIIAADADKSRGSKDCGIIVPEASSRQGEKHIAALTKTLAQRPVPQYAHDSDRIYGMPFMGCDIKFRVEGDRIIVTDVIRYEQPDDKGSGYK